MILYSVYAAYATLCKDQLISALAGLVLLVVCMLINMRTLKGLMIDLTDMIKKFKNRRDKA